MTFLLLIIAVFWLAFSNGANDNFKGVATLHGSQTASYGGALAWATTTTFAGSAVAVGLAGSLVRSFSGEGLLPEGLRGAPEVLAAVGGSGAVTVFLATVLGLPTSTTHALLGALLGVSLVGGPSRNPWGVLGDKFLEPLLVSPFLAVAATGFLYALLKSLRASLGITRETCVCIGEAAPELALASASCFQVTAPLAPGVGATPVVTVGKEPACLTRYHGRVMGLSAQRVVDVTHYLSAGAVCFARAINDTPKIAALILAAGTGFQSLKLGLVACAMAIGGVLGSRRVARTMSERITSLNPGQGLTANLVTAVLVLGASRLGLPVSTTHVSCGAIFGIGLASRDAEWKTIARILTAWATTLPLAALLGAVAFSVLKQNG